MIKRTISIILGLGFLILIASISLGFYPVLKVNSDWITKRELDARREGFKKLAGKDQEWTSKIESEFLNFIVNDSLTSEELEKMSPEVLSDLIRQKTLNAYESIKNEEGWGNIWTGFVLPGAKRDVLTERLILDGKEFGGWLQNVKKSAEVTLFSFRFKWDGESVSVRKD